MQINEQHLPLLHSLAWKFHRVSGIDIDELYGEACLAAVIKMQKYDPDKGAVSTFLYKVIWNHFMQYSHANHRPRIVNTEMIEHRQPDKSTMFSAWINEMNPQARKLCKLILNEPDKFLDMDMSALKAYLLSANWAWAEIRMAFKDIKNFLRTK
jgi:RNA polymerase sigma factor (sigma-70 family)